MAIPSFPSKWHFVLPQYSDIKFAIQKAIGKKDRNYLLCPKNHLQAVLHLHGVRHGAEPTSCSHYHEPRTESGLVTAVSPPTAAQNTTSF